MLKDYPYTVLSTQTVDPAIFEDIEKSTVTGLDIETTSLDPRDGEIRLIQICTQKDHGPVYVFDLFQMSKSDIDKLFLAISNSKCIWVGHNLKFEQKWLWFKRGIELWPLFDTWRASCLIFNGILTQKHNLYAVWEKYLNYFPQSPDLGGSDWKGPLSVAQYDYAAEDVIKLHLLRDTQKSLLAQYDLNRIALIEFDVIQADAEIELNGFPIDQEMWKKLAKANEIARDKFAKELVKELPSPSNQLTLFGDSGINLESPQQLLASLRKLGLRQKVLVEGTNDEYRDMELQDTSELTLCAYTDTHPVVKKLLDYREKSTLLKTFGYEYLVNVRSDTGRLHSNFYPFTGAGRYSVKEPQTHNIPRLKEFRNCFRPTGTDKLNIFDYSGIEMRVIAQLSEDPELIRVFREPKNNDIHKATASFLLDVPYSSITKPQKQMAKPVNFGLGFGMGYRKLAVYSKANYGVNMSEDEAKRWKKKFFQKYQGIKKWHYKHIEKFQREGLVRTIGGRLRYLPPDAFSDVFSTSVSGTATGDALKLALKLSLKRLRKFKKDAFITHHVHDEIIVQTNNNLEEIVKPVEKIVTESMIESMQNFVKAVPVLVEGHTYADSWADKS